MGSRTVADLEKRLVKLTKDQLVQLCLLVAGSLFTDAYLDGYVRQIRMARVERDIEEAWAEYERLRLVRADAWDQTVKATGKPLPIAKRLQLELAAERAREAAEAAWMRWERLNELQIALYDDPWKGL